MLVRLLMLLFLILNSQISVSHASNAALYRAAVAALSGGDSGVSGSGDLNLSVQRHDSHSLPGASYDGEMSGIFKKQSVQKIPRRLGRRGKPFPFSADVDFNTIRYERANLYDIDQILELYDIFDDDDRRHLLILPEAQREEFFENEIRQGRVFVAKDDNYVIGFCRLFVVYSGEELQSILVDELRALNQNFTLNTPELAYRYNISLEQSQTKNFLASEKTQSHPIFSFNRSKRWGSGSNNIWIYFGTNFIAHPYRGKGIDTAMERMAFRLISHEVMACVFSRWQPMLYYMYGMIDPEEQRPLSQGRIKSFAWFIHTFFCRQSDGSAQPFSFFGFQAFKPDIVEYSPPRPQSPHKFLHKSRSALDLLDCSVHEGSRYSALASVVASQGISGKGCFVGFDLEAYRRG